MVLKIGSRSGIMASMTIAAKPISTTSELLASKAALKPQFERAKAHFKTHPNQIKCSRKLKALTLSHSIIKIKDKNITRFYAIANQAQNGPEAVLGEGSFGRVKTVQDEAGKNYALKIEGTKISKDDDAEDKVLSLLTQSFGRAERRLNPPRIFKKKLRWVKKYGVQTLHKGESLKQFLSRYKGAKTPLPQAEKRAIALAAAKEVERLHALGVLHNDIKPDNFIINYNRKKRKVDAICTVDYGLSIITNKKRLAVTLDYHQGTPEYMAPEITKAYHYSQASEVFALGKMCELDLELKDPLIQKASHPDKGKRPALGELIRHLISRP